MTLQFVIPGNPKPKPRPRFRGRHTYPLKDQVIAEKKVADAFLDEYPGWVPDGESSFSVVAGFYREDFRRADVDNLMKLVMDALNKVAWADDAQVVSMQAFVIRGQESPRTEVTIYEVRDIPWRRS